MLIVIIIMIRVPFLFLIPNSFLCYTVVVCRCCDTALRMPSISGEASLAGVFIKAKWLASVDTILWPGNCCINSSSSMLMLYSVKKGVVRTDTIAE